MSSLRRLDAFVKPREDLRTRSALGGLITLIAASAATLLFFGQVFLYIKGSTRHSLHLSESMSFAVPTLSMTNHPMERRRGKIPLNVYVTFPHVKCSDIDISLDGGSVARGKTLRTRMPTESELVTALGRGVKTYPPDGCTVQGTLFIPKVGGTFSITVSKQAWAAVNTFALFRVNNQGMQNKMHNVSHYVHEITFGTPSPHSHNPLKDASYMVQNKAGGVFLAHSNVRLIPTRHQQFFGMMDTYQLSVNQHIVQPETIMPQGAPHLPGMAILYDLSPLRVDYIETRDNVFGFISSLVSIVGGVFVTVGLVTGCLLHSAAAVAKKMD